MVWPLLKAICQKSTLSMPMNTHHVSMVVNHLLFLVQWSWMPVPAIYSKFYVIWRDRFCACISVFLYGRDWLIVVIYSWKVGASVWSHFLAMINLATYNVPCMKVWWCLFCSWSGSSPSKQCFGQRVNGEPISSWRNLITCSHYKGSHVGLHLAMWAGVRYNLCKIFSCVSLSESFGETNLQEANTSVH